MEKPLSVSSLYGDILLKRARAFALSFFFFYFHQKEDNGNINIQSKNRRLYLLFVVKLKVRKLKHPPSRFIFTLFPVILQMKGKRIKGNVCTAAHLNPPFLFLWNHPPFVAFCHREVVKINFHKCITLLYNAVEVVTFALMCPFLLKYLNFHPSFSSMSLFSTCTCTLNTHILISSYFSWEVVRIHIALSTVIFDHSYFTLKVCIHASTLTHRWSYQCRLICVAIMACFNCGDIFWGELDRTHKWDQAQVTTEPPGWWRVSTETTHLIGLRA